MVFLGSSVLSSFAHRLDLRKFHLNPAQTDLFRIIIHRLFDVFEILKITYTQIEFAVWNSAAQTRIIFFGRAIKCYMLFRTVYCLQIQVEIDVKNSKSHMWAQRNLSNFRYDSYFF